MSNGVKALGIATTFCLVVLVGFLSVSRFRDTTRTSKGFGQDKCGPQIKKTHNQLDNRPESTPTFGQSKHATIDVDLSERHLLAKWQAREGAGTEPGKTWVDLSEFVRKDWSVKTPYRLARGFAGTADIRQLHEMLSDKDWEPYWANIVTVLGMASDDVNSAPVIVDYFRRPDVTAKKVGVKIYSLRYLGRIGGPLAKETLTSAMTKDGAAALASEWIDSPLLAEDPLDPFWTRPQIIHFTQVAAIDGLVFLRDRGVNTMIRRCYEDAMGPTVEDRRLIRPFIMAMASIDLIEEIGLDGYLILQDRPQQFDRKLDQYVEKYSPCDRALNEKLRQMKTIKRKHSSD